MVPALQVPLATIRTATNRGVSTAPPAYNSGVRHQPLHRHRIPDLERHQILADLQRAIVGLPDLGDEFVQCRRRHSDARELDHMGECGELRTA